MALPFHPLAVGVNDELNAALTTADICACIFLSALDMKIFVVNSRDFANVYVKYYYILFVLSYINPEVVFI